MSRQLVFLTAVCGALALSGCAQNRVQPYDYTAFRQSNPHSILVLPPVNDSKEVDASNGFLSQTTLPLSEAGYYVFPIAVVQETFRQNGLTDPADIQAVKLDKLEKIFGADAVLYLKVKEYGASYRVIQSDTRVTAEAVLVDGKTGARLWSGRATASSTENQQNNSLLGALISAVIDQVASHIADRSHDMAAVTAARLFNTGSNNGILYGPRSKYYQNEQRPTAP